MSELIFSESFSAFSIAFLILFFSSSGSLSVGFLVSTGALASSDNFESSSTSALADVDELSKLSDEASAPVDTKKPKESMNYLAALLKNLRDKLDSLKRIPTDKLPEEEKDKIKQAIENAEKDSEKINSDIENLNKEQKIIDNLLNDKSNLLDKTLLLLVDAKDILRRYNESPQPYEVAVKDLQNIQPIIDNLNKLIDESNDLVKSLDDKQLPSVDIMDSVNYINRKIDHLKELEDKIKDDVKNEGNLINDKEIINENLKDIINRANDILSKETNPEDLNDIQKDISTLQNKLNISIDDSEVPLEVIQHSPDSDVWDLKDRLDEIAFALADQKENARKKMELQKIASDISDKVKEIQDKIKEAEIVESNPNSSTDELKNALDNLENIKSNLLPKLDEEFNKLPITPEVDGLRNKTLEEQAKLVEDLNNAESAINERIYSIDELGDLIASADMKLDSINKKLDETPLSYLDEILKIELEDILPLNSVTDEINDAADRANKKHLPELTNFASKLNEVTQKLGDRKKQAEDVIESQRKAAEELAEAERKAAEELAEAERQAAEAQKQAQDEIEKLVVAPINEENVPLIEEQLSKLPENSPVYEELKKKADDVKDKVEKVKNIKSDLSDIENTMKPAVEIKDEGLPLAEKVKDTEEKLTKLKDARPKLLAITWSGVPEVDEEIKKKQQELDDLIKSLEELKKKADEVKDK
uniref:TPR_REGION domain-containing protein n=1 Tax=Strongyloides stercoralis TaxID=6248 RepID=A0A0K0E6G5_STRER